jgi:hypothetical protein
MVKKTLQRRSARFYDETDRVLALEVFTNVMNMVKVVRTEDGASLSDYYLGKRK